MTLPTAEQVERAVRDLYAIPLDRVEPMLRFLASILKPSNAGRELDETEEQSPVRTPITDDDYIRIRDLARRYAARIAVLEGMMTQRANGYAEVVKGMRAEIEALKAECNRLTKGTWSIEIAKLKAENARITVLEGQLERAIDENMEKVLAMSDDQVRALCRLEGRDPNDTAKIMKQAMEIATLKAENARIIALHKGIVQNIEADRDKICDAYALENQRLTDERDRIDAETVERCCKLQCQLCAQGEQMCADGRHHQCGLYQVLCAAEHLRALPPTRKEG